MRRGEVPAKVARPPDALTPGRFRGVWAGSWERLRSMGAKICLYSSVPEAFASHVKFSEFTMRLRSL